MTDDLSGVMSVDMIYHYEGYPDVTVGMTRINSSYWGFTAPPINDENSTYLEFHITVSDFIGNSVITGIYHIDLTYTPATTGSTSLSTTTTATTSSSTTTTTTTTSSTTSTTPVETTSPTTTPASTTTSSIPSSSDTSGSDSPGFGFIVGLIALVMLPVVFRKRN